MIIVLSTQMIASLSHNTSIILSIDFDSQSCGWSCQYLRRNYDWKLYSHDLVLTFTVTFEQIQI